MERKAKTNLIDLSYLQHNASKLKVGKLLSRVLQRFSQSIT